MCTRVIAGAMAHTHMHTHAYAHDHEAKLQHQAARNLRQCVLTIPVIMSKVAAFIVGDSNLFHEDGPKAANSVYHHVKRVFQATPVFGMTIMNLADCPDTVEEMLHYLKCMSVDKHTTMQHRTS